MVDEKKECLNNVMITQKPIIHIFNVNELMKIANRKFDQVFWPSKKGVI